MREKRKYTIITFGTTTAAMAMEKACMQQGIPGRLIPVPTQITAGCGLAWRIPEEEFEAYHEQIRCLEVPCEQIVNMEI